MYDISLGLHWDFYGISLGSFGIFDGIPMASLWDFHDVLKIFLWDSCKVSMVFPEDSSVGFLLDFHEVSTESLPLPPISTPPTLYISINICICII